MYLVLLIFYSIGIVVGIGNIALSLQVKSNQNEPSSEVPPDNLDWRTKGVVTPVQDYSTSPHVAAVVMIGK
ncbi:unnamed protein product [Rotaria sordida]|uniref:Uncharacterized protein n=1 Tax=Rotaria sordida TaxID=392033 RepID=A0A814MEL3_9BILA|nr:unnamed protein product [Rotaria sordida]CAF1133891.1 unnamed protein product [Rotaria sordida]CAF1253367.1 unnamed protein product [Rotaria sordida]